MTPLRIGVLGVLLLAGGSAVGVQAAETRPARAQAATDDREAARADAVLEGLAEPALRALLQEALERNPGLAAVRATARAAAEVPAQAGSLPDPILGATGYVGPPETRVGPQRAMATLSQHFPWFGKLGLRAEAAERRAEALDARWQAQRLALVTQVRRLAYELGFLDAYAGVVREDQRTLEHYEQLARARYASGTGLEQGVIKIQAEITKDETRLLEVGNRRAALVAALNALRDRPQETPLPPLPTPGYGSTSPDPEGLRERAMALRPELAEADAEVARAESLIELARREYKPDFSLGVSYGFVGPRTDPAGLMAPPPDEGDDVFAVSLSLNLPVRRGRLAAGVREAAEARTAAAERRRSAVVAIDADLGELVERVRLTWDQLDLLERVLVVQAEQSLRSAEAGYSAGTLNSLDLLDAERVLLEVRTATARARADYAIAIARLEGAVGRPLAVLREGEGP